MMHEHHAGLPGRRISLAAMATLAISLASLAEGAVAQVQRSRSAVTTASRGEAILQIRELLRFDPAMRQWRRLPLQAGMPGTIASSPPPGRAVVRTTSGAVVGVLPREIGLYLLRWTENSTLHESKVFVGPVSCNDLMMGAAPAGMVAACVPSRNQGMAMFIPLPPAPRDP